MKGIGLALTISMILTIPVMARDSRLTKPVRPGLEAKAQAGFRHAMVELGYYYQTCGGMVQDYTKAFDWYQRASQHKEHSAFWAIGYFYAHGMGVKNDQKMALKWWRDAANLGAFDIHYKNMEGFVKKAQTEYFTLLQGKVARGDAQAMADLGRCYQRRFGVEQRDIAMAISMFKKSSEKGNTQAMEDLGNCYEYGDGVNKDYATAMDWYSKAAKKKSASAMARIGDLYFYAKTAGGVKDVANALFWWRRAGDGGDSHAIYQIAQYHLERKENSIAMLDLKKSALKGNHFAACDLGDIYYKGEIAEKNFLEALGWYKMASSPYSYYSYRCIGFIYYSGGHGVRQDYNAAKEWFEKAADEGDPIAMNCIGVIYCDGRLNNGESRTFDYLMAKTWWEKAEDVFSSWSQVPKSYSWSSLNLGYIFFNGWGVDKDLEKAKEWWQKSAERGNTTAMFRLGKLYQSQGKRYDKEAFGLFFRSANDKDSPSADAMHYLSLCYRFGHGTAKDLQQADYWEKKAQETGSDESDAMFQLLTK